MSEDYVEASDAQLAAVRELALAELVADPGAQDAVRRISWRMVRRGQEPEDFAQELWLTIVARVRASWDPSLSPVRAWMLSCLEQWACSVHRGFAIEAKRTPIPVAELPEVECPPDHRELTCRDFERLRMSLGKRARRHLDLRVESRSFDKTSVAAAEALGISRRQERTRWQAVLRSLRASARLDPDGRELMR